MNKDLKDIRFNADLTTLITIYRQYKNFFLPVGIIVASIIIFFLILIPQVQGVLSAKEQENVETQKLNSLKNSFTSLSSMDEATLNQNSQNLDRALPSKKDFAGIINSISSNSVKSGVSVGNFEFSVGNLNLAQEGLAQYPSIQITLNVIGSPNSTLDFIKSLYESVPLAEVTSIKLSGQTTTLKALFYYKAYQPVNLRNASNVSAFSSSDNNLISKINSWSSNISDDLLPISLGSELPSTDSGRTNPFQ